MRLKIRLDVRKPLKRKKKIYKKDGTECVVQCKYERLGDFCFICGMLTHTERFCGKKLDIQQQVDLKEWVRGCALCHVGRRDRRGADGSGMRGMKRGEVISEMITISRNLRRGRCQGMIMVIFNDMILGIL